MKLSGAPSGPSGLSSVRVVALAVCVMAMALAAFGAGKSLQIYLIDTEGGQSTLVVSPSGQSILVDTGWPGFGSRDADRIVAAAKDAGVSELNFVIITHFHRDHVGGVPQLLSKMKVGTFIDHGQNREDSDVTRDDYAAYEKSYIAASGSKRESLKPGDIIPITGIRAQVLTADGEHIAGALPGGGEEIPTVPVNRKRPSIHQRTRARSARSSPLANFVSSISVISPSRKNCSSFAPRISSAPSICISPLTTA